ncbi:hypothetical protein [Roseococcus microcysteis]|nr:hypothetical protein [Roseococcus microcysteis]
MTIMAGLKAAKSHADKTDDGSGTKNMKELQPRQDHHQITPAIMRQA